MAGWAMCPLFLMSRRIVRLMWSTYRSAWNRRARLWRRRGMHTTTFEYSVIRVVPRVEREVFLNVGVLLSCPFQDFLAARIELNCERVQAFSPWLDVALVEEYLRSITLICRGGEEAGAIGQLPQ